MVLIPDEKMKKKMSKDGSVLKFMYGVAGLGKGLAAAGAMFLFVGILLAAMLMQSLEMPLPLLAGGAAAVPGALLLVGGLALQKRRMDGWLKTYVKKTGLSQEDILRADAEFKEPGTVLISYDRQKSTNALQKIGFITTHYIKFPGVVPYMARLEDVVACFYTKRFLCKDGGYDKAFVAYSSDRKMAVLTSDISEQTAMEIVETVAKRHPAVIKDHHFRYQGREYDAARDMDEVIALYNQVTGAGES